MEGKLLQLDTKMVVTDILNTIEKQRERDIVARRFGLFARKETLEQIGEVLSITRERVRQLEKSVITQLKYHSYDSLPHIDIIESVFRYYLEKELGFVANIRELSAKFGDRNDKIQQARVSFLGSLSPKFTAINETDNYFHGLALSDYHEDEKDVKKKVDMIVATIVQFGKPVSVRDIQDKLGDGYSLDHIDALAGLSKQLSYLNKTWGLNKWPTVNPKNIRDKIYLILKQANKPLHFSKISQEIHKSNFKRRKVTVQAIHNELIKDNRFILVGRGTYALKQWGYEKGTVKDVIHNILKQAAEPLHRDEIVKQVLQKRQVKQTTVLLNLQSQKMFERVGGGKYRIKPQK